MEVDVGKRETRIKDLLHIIGTYNGITIRDLAVMKGVSELTIRRDVQILEESRLVNNVRGTVFFNHEEDLEQSYLLSIASNRHRKEKKNIGEYAAGLIQPGVFVIIDNGSTTEHVAANIPFDAEITVLCYSMNALNSLYKKPNINLIFCGGNFRHQSLMFECAESLEIIRRARAHKVFVSAAGVHQQMGVTCASEYELACKREIMKASLERILLVDSSKFGNRLLRKFLPVVPVILHLLISHCAYEEFLNQFVIRFFFISEVVN